MRRLPVIYREEASNDLEEIVMYLREQGASRAAAIDIIGRIKAQCEVIGGIPEGYPVRQDLGAGIRLAPFERSAVIAYRVSEASIVITNVFYGGRNYGRLTQKRGDD